VCVPGAGRGAFGDRRDVHDGPTDFRVDVVVFSPDCRVRLLAPRLAAS
jgi:hypothetical protein